MEKKTIGNFISVLRRAHGMTQKELGEKLFVSDKTVSRWERDECTPDLSLIPVIADLFGVTADELLRGERKTETEAEFQKSEKGSVKSEKQYRYLLQKRATDFKNLLFISVSLACLGLVAAMVCNLGFLQATLGFGLGAIFWIAGAVCLICSFNHYYLRVEEEGERTENFYFNAHMIYLSKNTVYIFLAVLGILLPLLFIPAYMGLTAPWWLLFGGLSALLLLLTVSFIYEFFIKIQWMKKGYLIYDESAVLLRNGRMKLIKRLGFVGGLVSLALLLGLALVRCINIYDIQKPLIFDTFEEFRSYAEQDGFHDYIVENGSYIVQTEEEILFDGNSEKIPTDEIGQDPSDYCEVLNHKGEAIYSYYQENGDILHVEFSFSDENPSGLPIKAYTVFTLQLAQIWIDNISTLLIACIALDLIVCLLVYAVKRKKTI